MTQKEALDSLDFGSVNSEEEVDLDRLFVQTQDFRSFLDPKIWVILGAKGTGKSALFEYFTKYEATARMASGAALQNVILGAATGFGDLSEIATQDFEDLKSTASGYDHTKLWRLYIAVKAGLALPTSISVPRGPLKDLRTAIGGDRDFRVGPLLAELWTLAIGRAPESVTISAKGASVSIKGGRANLDVTSILKEIDDALAAKDKTFWLMFDKVDEIWPQDRAERKRALEGLMSAAMDLRKKFPRIQPIIFMRTDLWGELDFTNKDHILGKYITLDWSPDDMASLLVKRAVQAPSVRAYIEGRDPGVTGRSVDAWSMKERLFALKCVFPETPYSGPNESSIESWIVERVTDGNGTALPRDAIVLATFATDEQRKIHELADHSLISRPAIREGYTLASRAKASHYLSEFPELKSHFRRFANQQSATFSRQELLDLMEGLQPSGDELLERLHEIGLIRPNAEDILTASGFEIPRLFRKGLGFMIPGRP